MNKRVIAKLDVKNHQLIKTIQMEGLRVVGNPADRMQSYSECGIDEVIYHDLVASLYDRSSILDLVEKASSNCFIPLTVSGGIRSVYDARQCQLSGADKFGINTSALANPILISEISSNFGSQATVLSVEAKKMGRGVWNAFFDSGREDSGRTTDEWIAEAVERGAGEILLTSIDMEGTRRGFDIDLANSIAEKVNIPIVVNGGAGTLEHIVELLQINGVDGVVLSSILHFDLFSISEIKDTLKSEGISIRP